MFFFCWVHINCLVICVSFHVCLAHMHYACVHSFTSEQPKFAQKNHFEKTVRVMFLVLHPHPQCISTVAGMQTSQFPSSAISSSYIHCDLKPAVLSTASIVTVTFAVVFLQ